MGRTQMLVLPILVGFFAININFPITACTTLPAILPTIASTQTALPLPSATITPKATTPPTPELSPTIFPVPGDPLLQEFQAHDGPVTFVGFTPDGTELVSGSQDGVVKFWELSPIPNPIQIFSGHQEGVASVAFSPNGELMAVGARNGAIKLWNLSSGKLTKILGATGRINQIAFSPDGSLLAAALSDWTIMSWQLPRGQLSWTIEGHRSEFSCIAFSKNGEWLVAGEKEGDTLVYRLKTLQIDRTYPSYQQGVAGLVFAPDGRLLAIRHGDGYINLQDFESIAIRQRLGSPFRWDLSADNLAFTSDGKSLAEIAGNVLWWDVASGQADIGYGVGADSATSLAFSPDGNLLVAGQASGKITIWELRK